MTQKKKEEEESFLISFKKERENDDSFPLTLSQQSCYSLVLNNLNFFFLCPVYEIRNRIGFF